MNRAFRGFPNRAHIIGAAGHVDPVKIRACTARYTRGWFAILANAESDALVTVYSPKPRVCTLVTERTGEFFISALLTCFSFVFGVGAFVTVRSGEGGIDTYIAVGAREFKVCAFVHAAIVATIMIVSISVVADLSWVEFTVATPNC